MLGERAAVRRDAAASAPITGLRTRQGLVEGPVVDAATGSTVLFLINDLRTGGAERTLVNYLNHLRRLQPVLVLINPQAELLAELSPSVEVLVLSRRASSAEVGAAQPSPGPAGPAYRRGRPRGQMPLELPGLLVRAWRLARLARTHRCSAVSTFLNRSHTIALTAKLLFAPRLRVVINVHEMLSQHLQIHFAAVERQLMKWFIRWTFPRAASIVVVSEGVRRDLVQHFRLDPDRITVVHNPIDVVQVRERAAEPAPEISNGVTRPLIVAVGRLVHLKGLDLLIRVVGRLPPQLRGTVFVIGEGEERSRLEHLISRLGMSDRVRLLGHRSNPWKYMAKSDVVALCSRTEAFPNVIGEALALSRPVVATYCSEGVREYLNGGECGLLVPPEDVDALAQALTRVLTEAPLRRRFRREGLRRVEIFDIARTVERYESLLARICSA